MTLSKSDWKLHGNCMTELVSDCFHRDYFLHYVASTFDDEDNVNSHIKLIANLLHIRHGRENHMQGKLQHGRTPFTL